MEASAYGLGVRGHLEKIAVLTLDNMIYIFVKYLPK
jgi:hypothetical protein